MSQISGDHAGPNEPLEFKVLERRPTGFGGMGSVAWFNGPASLGEDRDLESLLNSLGAEGWDIIQVLTLGGTTDRIVLRRRAR